MDAFKNEWLCRANNNSPVVGAIKNVIILKWVSIHPLQEADLAIAPLTLTAAREKVVGMSKPFMQTGISILLRKDISEETGFFDFLTPFTAETWVGILIAYLGTAACIFIVTRLVIQVVKAFSVPVVIFSLMFNDLMMFNAVDLNTSLCFSLVGIFYLSAGRVPLIAIALISHISLCKCRLSPCEWNQPQSEQNRFSFLHSLWYTAGALTLQGKQLNQTLQMPPHQQENLHVPCTYWLVSFLRILCSICSRDILTFGDNSFGLGRV